MAKNIKRPRGRPAGKDRFETVDHWILALTALKLCESQVSVTKAIDITVSDLLKDQSNRTLMGANQKQIVRRVRDRLSPRKIKTSDGGKIEVSSSYAALHTAGHIVEGKPPSIGRNTHFDLQPTPRPLQWLNWAMRNQPLF